MAVCFDAPVVELFERRAEVVHPTISMLGPDLLDASYDQAEAVRRLHDPSRAETAIGEAMLDQRAIAGIGNVYKSEVLFIEQVDPFAPVGPSTTPRSSGSSSTAREQLRPTPARGRPGRPHDDGRPKTGKRLAPSRLWVYDRAGRPCHRCGTLIRVESQGTELPRTTYWCPSCQAPSGVAAVGGAKSRKRQAPSA